MLLFFWQGRGVNTRAPTTYVTYTLFIITLASKKTCTIHITIQFQTSILFAHASTRLFLHPRHPKRMLSQSSRQRRVLPYFTSCTLVQLIPKLRRSAARTACTRAAAAPGSGRRARRSRRARRRGAARRSTACCRRRWRRSATGGCGRAACSSARASLESESASSGAS